MKVVRTCLAGILLLPASLFGQKNDPVQAPTFGVHFLYNDFKTAAAIRSTSLSAVLRDKTYARIKDMTPGIALNYIQGLSSRFDISVMLAGSFPDYPREDGSLLGENSLLLEADLSVRGKMFSENYWVSPYLQLGAGLSKYKNYWGAFIAAGMGIQVNLPKEFYLIINSQYRIPVTEKTVSDHLFYSLGIAGNIRKKAKPVVKTMPVPVIQKPVVQDRDADGIVDSADLCPDKPGIALFKGCPDLDGDSIPDNLDKCPAIYGLLRLEGCPVPDTDRDGFNDEVDSCVTVPGVAAFKGCPAPDREEMQRTLNIAAENIFFATGKYELLPASFAALDTVVNIMKRDGELQLSIEGHTDNVGDAEKNKVLSEQRARAVFDYINKKGIDASRLMSMGYGEERPRDTNATADGRSRNRRVEMRFEH